MCDETQLSSSRASVNLDKTAPQAAIPNPPTGQDGELIGFETLNPSRSQTDGRDGRQILTIRWCRNSHLARMNCVRSRTSPYVIAAYDAQQDADRQENPKIKAIFVADVDRYCSVRREI
jgi:hypothetical protein